MAAARGDYTRVPVEEGVELKNAQQRSQSPQPRAPAPRQGEEPPASRAMVVFSVGFYLVAAIVVRPLSLPLFYTWSCAPRWCELELARCTCHGRVRASGGGRLGRRARAEDPSGATSADPVRLYGAFLPAQMIMVNKVRSLDPAPSSTGAS